MKKHLFISGFGLLMSVSALATIINVPGDYAKIQTAIDHSTDGDTVLVAPGTYYENVNLEGKKIVLTSYYMLDGDNSYIQTTIINGSQPNHPDTTSCILMISGEDSTTVLQGFTLTGGQGTAWKDEHSSGTYREGGGVLVALSSPVIRNNIIMNNYATNITGLISAGGGGIRCGDGKAKILNNVILNNDGRYGGGIVLNWCSATIRNNVIVANEGGEDYGSGGIWINNVGAGGEPNILENNTIVNNHSATNGGGVLCYNSNAKAVFRNNIIYGNTARSFPQISLRGATIPVNYCDVEGGFNGTGNIDSFPQFQDTMFYLNSFSPCIDAGDTNSLYNDPEYLSEPGNALFPAMGTVKNDMGAYGGPGSSSFSDFDFSRIRVTSSVSFGNSNTIGIPVRKTIAIVNQSTEERRLDSVVVAESMDVINVVYFPENSLEVSQSDSIIIEWTPTDDEQLIDTLLIYHTAIHMENPVKVALSGKALTPSVIENPNRETIVQNYPNPFDESTTIKYCTDGNTAKIIISDTNGKTIFMKNDLPPEGEYIFHRNDMISGIYLFQIIGEHKFITGKMTIVD